MSEFVDFIDIEIDFPFPEPRVIASRIDALADELRDMTPALEASKSYIVGDVKEHFANHHGPDGTTWAPWSDSYEPVASRTNIDMLRRDDMLYDAATDEGNYDVRGNDIFIDTSNFPPYWRIQQLGGAVNTGTKAVKRYGERRRGDKLSGKIPPRPYLGMSEESRVKVINTFDLWMEGAIARFVTNPRTGHTQPIYTIAGGRPTFGRAIR